MDDELLRGMTFNWGWRRPCVIIMFGRPYTLELTISAFSEEDVIEDGQRKALIYFLQNGDEMFAASEPAVFSYYMSIVDECRERFGPSFADEWAPVISRPDQMEKLIQPTVVLIQDSVDGDREVIGLLFNCCWDTSHGMAVKFVEGELVKVGPQDIVL